MSPVAPTAVEDAAWQTLDHRLQSQLQQLKQQANYRTLYTSSPCSPGWVEVTAGQPRLNLSSNDYLGLVDDPSCQHAFQSWLANRPAPTSSALPGSTGSRLMSGNTPDYQRIEDLLSHYYQRDRVLIFNSGYHLNIGVLPALSSKRDLILADKRCHASLIDGMRLSRAKMIRYPHHDYQRLEALLKQYRHQYEQVFIVTESIFSMDGDCADLPTLVALKHRYNTLLYVDEAHAIGLLGDQGLGLGEQTGLMAEIDLLVGTFGKALAGQGGFIACSNPVADYLVNQARPFIFSTALPPVSLQWLLFICHYFPSLQRARQEIATTAQRLRHALSSRGLQTGGSSHIIPVILGQADKTVTVAQQLAKYGFQIHPVRPPTVPAGQARLRISLTHPLAKNPQLDRLPALIQQLCTDHAVPTT